LYAAINLSGNGKGNIKIDAALLASGAYQYTMYINGKLIDTIKLLL
jgi:trimeric autotransporter adhesin